MTWSLIDRKVSAVRAQLNGAELQALEREFAESLKKLSLVHRLPRGVQSILLMDIIYAINQHKDWLQTPVFSVLLVEFLQLDHGVSRGDAELLVHDMIDVAIQLGLGGKRSIFSSDRDFLTCAYVSAAGAQDESLLEAELGLGTAVLSKLRDGIKALESVDQNVFVPEYDAMLASIVLELSQELKLLPWAMDCYRLKYALLRAGGDAAQPFILAEALPLILDALVAIGWGHKFTLAERPALADLLVEAGILMDVKKHPRQKNRGLALTDLGSRLTTLKVSSALSEGIQLPEFFRLNSIWQQAIIKNSESMSFEYLATLATEAMNKISPEVIETIFLRMFKSWSDRVDAQLIKKCLESCKMGWHKAAIIRSLRGTKPSRALLDVVTGEVNELASPGVRMAAGSLLDSWTESSALR